MVGISNTVSLAVAGGGLIAIGAIRAGRAMREDAANFDAFRAGEPSDETHLAKLRYLEAVRRVLNREASDRDWTLINEYLRADPRRLDGRIPGSRGICPLRARVSSRAAR